MKKNRSAKKENKMDRIFSPEINVEIESLPEDVQDDIPRLVSYLSPLWEVPVFINEGSGDAIRDQQPLAVAVEGCQYASPYSPESLSLEIHFSVWIWLVAEVADERYADAILNGAQSRALPAKRFSVPLGRHATLMPIYAKHLVNNHWYRETVLTPQSWSYAIDFDEETGEFCDEVYHRPFSLK